MRLQQQVAELGERNAFGARDPPLHRLLLQHVVDGEMLADVAQELEQADGCRSQSALLIMRAALGDALKSRKRSSCARMPRALASICSVDSRLRSCALAAGIADHAGAAANERDRRMAELLQARERHDRQQVADVQARRRRVEADVGGNSFLGERFARAVGGVVELCRATRIPRTVS